MPSVSQQDAPLPGSLEEAQQRYEATKKALKAGLTKKRQIDRALTDLESQIFLFEGSYLASTATSGGNIVKGFDNYLKATATTGYGSKAAAAAAAALSAQEVPIEDRMFSLSSGTYARSLQLKASEGRSREQSPAAASGGGGGGKKGDKTDKAEKSGGKEKSKGKGDRGSSVDKEAEKSANGGDQTPQSGKGKKRDKDAGGTSVNGSHKKKRKDDD